MVVGIPDVVHMSMLAGSQACSYDRGHITGASSSTNGSSLVCYPRETLNPPPSPATTAASTRANSPTSRYRPYKHYRYLLCACAEFISDYFVFFCISGPLTNRLHQRHVRLT